MEIISKFVEKHYPSFAKLFVNDDKSENEDALSKVLFNVLVFAVLIASALICINLLIIGFTDKGGVFGDFLGGVLNPVFTFLTLFGLIATIVIQRQELRLARVEYEKTADALSTQAVETTFFNILDLHHNIVDNLKVDVSDLGEKNTMDDIINAALVSFGKVTPKTTVFNGRATFEIILGFITQNSKTPADVIDKYRFLQNESNHILGHYFRNLYQALKVIDGYDKNILSKERKRKYTSILRAQLSTIELALLFINCIEGVSDKGQFKNLLIEYSMLEHLPITKTDDGYLIAKRLHTSDDVLQQFKIKKEFTQESKKYYGGAFGKNGGIPHY